MTARHSQSFMIFYGSFNEDIFREQLKVAKVSPIFKVGKIEEIGNYRPIYVLPIFIFREFERIMYNKACQYFKVQRKWHVFPKTVYFQVNNSTHHAVLNLIDGTLTSFEKGQFTSGIFIDLSKAFDNGNQCVLLHKLELYGIKVKCLNWFRTYAIELLVVYHRAPFLDLFCFSYT